MRLLAFSDLHIYPYSEFSKPSASGFTTLIEEQDATFQWLEGLVDSLRPDYLIDAGDAVHTHGYIDSLSLNTIYLGYSRLAAACKRSNTRFRHLLSNHEIYSSACRIHTLPFLQDHIVGCLTEENGVFFIPSYSEREDVLHFLQRSPCKIVFIHTEELQGAMYSAASRCDTGWTTNELEGDDRHVFVGGIHYPGTYSRTSVIGSALYRTFSDDYQRDVPRGALLYDTDTHEVRRLENPYTSIYLTLRPKTLADILQITQSTLPFARAYARIIYPAELDTRVRSLASLFKGVRLVAESEELGGVERPEEVSFGTDPGKLLDLYYAGLDTPLDRDKLLKMARSYL